MACTTSSFGVESLGCNAVGVQTMLPQMSIHDVNAKDKRGCTALIAASLNGHLGVVHQLLRTVVLVDAKMNDGKKLLAHCCRSEKNIPYRPSTV